MSLIKSLLYVLYVFLLILSSIINYIGKILIFISLFIICDFTTIYKKINDFKKRNN